MGASVVPGEKLCPRCREHLNNAEKDNINEEIPGNDKEIDDFQPVDTPNDCRHSLNSTLTELEISPFKVHALPSYSKMCEGKRKINQIEEAVKKKMAVVLDVSPAQLTNTSSSTNLQADLTNKANDLDHLVECMKEKLKLANRREKIQILTLTPKSWSVRRAAEEFNVSKSAIQKSRLLKANKGIIAIEETCTRTKISEDLVNRVVDFYCSDENSRQLSGKKDYVSVKTNEHVQKRLLLCNIKELHSLFKVAYPNDAIGFSKFASLRPKWCITAGPKGTHSVCICSHHQNMKLMLDAIDLADKYHELIERIVCDRNSKECMVHRCESCTGVNGAKLYLEQFLREKFEFHEDITFKQWVTTDRSSLISQTLPVDEFITLISEKLDAITSHSYIARNQSQYLKNLKEELSQDEVIVLGDFAENHQFLIQDEVQGYHWNSQQCSLHPVVIYYVDTGELKVASFCVISNDLVHDVAFVYKVLSESIQYIHEYLNLKVSKIHYFSDGCAGQYKNKKHFLNLCMHKSDFLIDCAWNFFATSHGKSPCDGIGGTVKRTATKASLQRPLDQQITTAKEMYLFCENHIKNVAFSYVSDEEMSKVRIFLDERFKLAKSIPGTRSFHQYIPLNKSTISCKRVSNSLPGDHDLVFEFFQTVNQLADVKMSSYILCIYDSFRWVGFVIDTDDENKDAQVKFMHPHYPSPSYHWPQREDICWIPYLKIVTVIDPPSLTSVGARQYKIKPNIGL